MCWVLRGAGPHLGLNPAAAWGGGVILQLSRVPSFPLAYLLSVCGWLCMPGCVLVCLFVCLSVFLKRLAAVFESVSLSVRSPMSSSRHPVLFWAWHYWELL